MSTSIEQHYRYILSWRNVGIGIERGGFYVLTPIGNLIVKPWEDRLFSERYGTTPHVKIVGRCVSFVRLREFTQTTPLEA